MSAHSEMINRRCASHESVNISTPDVSCCVVSTRLCCISHSTAAEGSSGYAYHREPLHTITGNLNIAYFCPHLYIEYVHLDEAAAL